MKSFKILLITTLLLSFLSSCRTSSEVAERKDINVKAGSSESQIAFGAPINSPDNNEITKDIYRNNLYFLLQEEQNRFKDNAPFIEVLDSGKRERLWFTSSRADNFYFARSATNLYQQIYYCEREVGEGKCPLEGWSEPQLLFLQTDVPALTSFYDSFNHAVKGTVAVSGNTMIVSCSQLEESFYTDYKNLWSIDNVDGQFINPTPISSLSNQKTWESQPSLSANGNHLFFVSNRLVNARTFDYSNDETGDETNIFYSFRNENGEWGKPVVVKELFSNKFEVTPHISINGDQLYFSSDRNGKYQIFSADIALNDIEGGYTIKIQSVRLFDRALVDICSSNRKMFEINKQNNYKYPFHYFNPKNQKTSQAFLWASDNPGGFGSYDIYGCNMPYNIKLNVELVDLSEDNNTYSIELPILELKGADISKVLSQRTTFNLLSGLDYQVYGGSNADADKGTYYCDLDDQYIFNGYSKIVNQTDPSDRLIHTELIKGAELASQLTLNFNNIPVYKILSDTTINDTIFITKAWTPKPKCPDILEIPQKHTAIPYFQTGFWEVNTSVNLKRDLELLHQGFIVAPNNDIYNPRTSITAKRSGYKAFEWETHMPAINLKDESTYSIADARWVELHPLNYNWGDRPDFRATTEARLRGRKNRIDQYIKFAEMVDENLQVLTDTISLQYINFLDLHKETKPKLLIEIFAVSDQREVSRGWYIGDTVQYRSSAYLGNGEYSLEPIKIIPPKVDEKSKTLVQIKPCSIELNEDGDNGSMLGITRDKTEINTNLSRLRAWFGYKEIFERLSQSEKFSKYLSEGRVALPDNNVEYNEADIIILTHGRRIDVIDPQNPYPEMNNPNKQGYYDYDQVRRVEIRIRLLIENDDQEVKKDYCCTTE
jgi:hypothetical protein